GGTSLRAMKSSQSLNFSLLRAAMIAFERCAPTCGSLSSSASVAVLRLILVAAGAVATPVVVGFAGAGADTAGPGFAGCIGCVPWAKAGTDRSATVIEIASKRVSMWFILSGALPARQRGLFSRQAERAFLRISLA